MLDLRDKTIYVDGILKHVTWFGLSHNNYMEIHVNNESSHRLPISYFTRGGILFTSGHTFKYIL